MRRLLRLGVLVVSAVLGSALVVWCAARALSWSGVQRSPMALDLIAHVKELPARVASARRIERIVVVGDSVLSLDVPHPVTVATELTLRRLGSRARVLTLTWPGWSVWGEYCLADEILRAKPDRIVLELNLRGLGAGSAASFGNAELAGFISTSRFAEASLLPLAQAGITSNRLLLYRALVESDMTPLWFVLLDIQARLYNLRVPFEQAIEEGLHVHTLVIRTATSLLDVMRRTIDPGKNREGRQHALSTLGSVVRGIDPSYPPLRTLAAVVRRFSGAKTRPLVWIAPVNVDHLRDLGVDLAGLERTVRSIRKVVEANGGTLVDFHAVLRDHSFSDSGDHPTAEGALPGTELLGSLLGRAILKSTPKTPSPNP